MIPAFKDILINPNGFFADPPSPLIEDRGPFKDVLYSVKDIVSDWDAYSADLARHQPDFRPRVLLISHDMSEIENIPLIDRRTVEALDAEVLGSQSAVEASV